MRRTLKVGEQTIQFPAYFPVTTFGKAYPLDDLIRPYLPRLAQGVMVAYHYARQMLEDQRPSLPVLIDSGGFACLFDNATVIESSGLGEIYLQTEDGIEAITPMEVIEFQERHASIAFTLDFPIPPGTDRAESARRRDLTINNAIWAIENKRRRDLPLFAVVQGWDLDSFMACAVELLKHPFAGLAIGGLVPRLKDKSFVAEVVAGIRGLTDLPLHVFGAGHPDTVKMLFGLGVDSVDSSSYVKAAAAGRLWAAPDFKLNDPSPSDRLHLALANLAQATGVGFPLSALTFYAPFLKSEAK